MKITPSVNWTTQFSSLLGALIITTSKTMTSVLDVWLQNGLTVLTLHKYQRLTRLDQEAQLDQFI